MLYGRYIIQYVNDKVSKRAIKKNSDHKNWLSCYKEEKKSSRQQGQRTYSATKNWIPSERSWVSHQSPSDNFPQDLPVRMLWFSKCSVASDKWWLSLLPSTPHVHMWCHTIQALLPSCPASLCSPATWDYRDFQRVGLKYFRLHICAHSLLWLDGWIST